MTATAAPHGYTIMFVPDWLVSYSVVAGQFTYPVDTSDRSVVVPDYLVPIPIGASPSVPVSVYGATPVVQATTGGSAATFNAHTSGIANDSATWDGYTMGQVVKALRNIGALA
jgi:hypothetical protein